MGRLTIRSQDGTAYWADARCASGGYRMDEDKRDQARLDRLAAYEDTGLEPKDVTDLMAAHGTAIGALAAYRTKIPFDRLDEAAALREAQDDGLIQPMSCTGCRYGQTSRLREHEAHCMRCIRNRYPEDHYTRAEAEATLEAQDG